MHTLEISIASKFDIWTDPGVWLSKVKDQPALKNMCVMHMCKLPSTFVLDTKNWSHWLRVDTAPQVPFSAYGQLLTVAGPLIRDLISVPGDSLPPDLAAYLSNALHAYLWDEQKVRTPTYYPCRSERVRNIWVTLPVRDDGQISGYPTVYLRYALPEVTITLHAAFAVAKVRVGMLKHLLPLRFDLQAGTKLESRRIKRPS